MEKVIFTSLNENELEQVISRVLRNNHILPSTSDVSFSQEQTLNQKEAAIFLGISQTTIIKWKKMGKIPYEQIPGSSKIRFYKTQLKKVVGQNPHLLQAARD